MVIKLSDGLQINTDNENLFILNKDKLICYTKILKSKIDLLFPIYNNNIQINLNYEKIKGNEIIIELKDEIEILKLIENRINLKIII